MEYQKITNLIDDDALNQPSKFRTRNWVEINDESRGAYNVNSQIKFKNTMLKSSLCDHSDAYIFVKGNIGVNNTAAQGAANNTNKKVIFKNCAPFTNCISKINNTQIDNAKDIDIVMPMYNLIEYSDNYAKTTGSFWQYSKDIPARNVNGTIIVFDVNNVTDSFNYKVKFTGQTENNGTKDVEIMVPLKYLSNFWRTLEMPLISCEVNLILTWSTLTPETMKLLGSTESKITKDKNSENVPHLEIVELVLVHCNLVNNDYQKDSRILYTFVPNKTFGSLLEISPTNQVSLKTFNSEFQEVKIWFTDQISKPLELEDKVNVTLPIK